MSKRKDDGIGLFQFSGPSRKDDWKQRQIDAARRGEWYGSGPPTIKHKAIKAGTINPNHYTLKALTCAFAWFRQTERALESQDRRWVIMRNTHPRIRWGRSTSYPVARWRLYFVGPILIARRLS